MKKILFISAVTAAMLFSGCGSSGGSSDTPAAGSGSSTAAGSGSSTAAGSGSSTAAGSGSSTAGGSNPKNGNDIKDGVKPDGTSNRPIDQIVTVGTRDWLVIQTNEIEDLNSTPSYNEAFFPKRTWAEADYFCKNFSDGQGGTWALPTQLELLSIMTPLVEDVKRFDENTAQFVVDSKVLPSEGTLNAFQGTIFYNEPNKAVYLGNGSLGSAQVSYETIDMGKPEEGLFTCIKQ